MGIAVKKIIVAMSAALLTAVSLTAVAASAHGHHDWRHDIALSGNDFATFLHYQPTDGASYAGKVRQAMRPSQVNP
jgi:hypothetical protein